MTISMLSDRSKRGIRNRQPCAFMACWSTDDKSVTVYAVMLDISFAPYTLSAPFTSGHSFWLKTFGANAFSLAQVPVRR